MSEPIKFQINGANEDGQSISVTYFNPFNTSKRTKNHRSFQDIIRNVNIVFKRGGVDEEATKERVTQVGKGVLVKMALAADVAFPTKKQLAAVEDVFGTANEEPELANEEDE